MAALRAGLSDYGYVEGKNIVIDFRSADGQFARLPILATELARLRVDLIVTGGTPATLAAKNATTTIPIVMVNTGDAVGTGLIASLARPGGNVTGVTILSPQLIAKRLELVKEMLPRTRTVAAILNPANPAQKLSYEAMESTARFLGIDLYKFEVRGPKEFEATFSVMAKRNVDALVAPQDAMMDTHAQEIADFTAKMRIPSAGNKIFADAGGLIGYGVDAVETFRRAATYVDKIIKGAKPAELPVEQASKFFLILNLKTAKALGITIPQSLLVRSDELIQ